MPSTNILFRGNKEHLAEREGFEPSTRDHRALAFQASSLSHSDTSPYLVKFSRFPKIKSITSGRKDRLAGRAGVVNEG